MGTGDYGMAQKILKKHPDIDGVFGGDLGIVACMNVALQRGMKNNGNR